MKGDGSMMHLKEAYYIEKKENHYTLKKKLSQHQDDFAQIGIYKSAKDAKEAAIREMIREEVNQRKHLPLHQIVRMIQKRYRELSF